MRKITIVTGSRAEYGILRPVMHAINKHPNLQLSVVVTGMHFSPEFGKTIKEIKKDGFNIDAKVDTLNAEDTNVGMARYIGKTISNISDTFEELNPDCILLLGDRAEILASSVAAAYMNIPIAHIHGGDISQGGLDEPARHVITKFAHIHFPATKKSAERIIRMGEERWRVHVVGAPALDVILNEKLIEPERIAKKYNLDLSLPLVLMVQHPVTTESDEAPTQIKQTLEAIVSLKYQTVLIYPNADAGGRRMIKVIKEYEKYPFIKTFKSLPHKDYLSIMKIASVMVGNSSSGIIEAPSFHLPVVNIGNRQKGRERSQNIIDVEYDAAEIKNAILKALYDEKFKGKVKKCINPYGDGHASERIAQTLAKVKIDTRLLQKRMQY